jgi:hypothetical protein
MYYALTFQKFCLGRADGSPLTTTQFFSRVLPFRPEHLLARFTALTTAFDWGKPMRDPLNAGRMNPAPGGLRMPESCSFGNWIAGSSTCGLLYKGFEDLFAGSDLRMTANVSDAGSGVVLPDVEVRCQGQHCSLLSNITFCRTSEDCSAGTTCEDYVFDTAYRGSFQFSTVDMVGDILWNDCCSGSSRAADWQCARSAPVCSPLDFRRSLHEWLTELSGASANVAVAEISSSLRICSVHPSAFDPAWAQSQIVRSGSVLWIKGLVSLGDAAAAQTLSNRTAQTLASPDAVGESSHVFSRSSALFDDAVPLAPPVLWLLYGGAGTLVLCLVFLVVQYCNVLQGPRKVNHMSMVGLVQHDSLASQGA